MPSSKRRQRRRRGFGATRRLPSGRWQASYVGPDTIRRNAPATFDTELDAEEWLLERRREISGGDWQPPIARRAPVTFGEYSTRWLANRPLKARTRSHYRYLLDTRILPTFDAIPVKAVSADLVGDWYTGLGDSTPTVRSQAYGLLRTILGDAVQNRVIEFNPAHIRGAGNAKRARAVRPATLDELTVLVDAMPTEKYRMMTLLATWCAMRFGELTELRRQDVDLKAGVIRIRRAVARVGGNPIVGTPKSDAGTRDVAVPPHLLPRLAAYVRSNITGGRDGLLFPAADGVSHMAPSTLYRVFYRAREQAGRPDLRFHDLRHTGAVLAAQTGATLAELMARLGHSTPGAAMRYQHAAQGRDMQIAAALSKLVADGD